MACVSQYAPLAGSQRKALRIPAVALFAPAMDMVTFSVAFLFCKATKIMCATSSRLTLEASMWLAPCVRTTTLSLLLLFLLFAPPLLLLLFVLLLLLPLLLSRRRYYSLYRCCRPNDRIRHPPFRFRFVVRDARLSNRQLPEQLKLNRHR